LPGIGPATAAGISAFAFDLPAVYLETNVRTVLLHKCFPDTDAVSDRELLPLLEAAARAVAERGISSREVNYALLDYGAQLKKEHPNPSRRSAHHSRQSPYEGSRRQKRARLLEAILATPGLSSGQLAETCGLDEALTEDILGELATEGFIALKPDGWSA
jgi:A/G-specific adenine glycosylase